MCPQEMNFSESLMNCWASAMARDLVTIALDLTTNAIAGKIINIPNMFDLWSGQTLHSTDVNTVIIAKEYRGMDFFHFLYAEAALKATARGIDRKTGTCIWSENIAAIKSFGQFSDEIQRMSGLFKNFEESERIRDKKIFQ